MTQVTGGSVTYGRTVKTGDFENKRCEVRVDFSVTEGDTSEQAMLDRAAQMALTKTNQVLYKPTEAVADTAAAGTGTVDLGTSHLAPQPGTTEAPKKRQSRKPPAAEEPTPAADPTAVEDPSAVVDEAAPAAADPSAVTDEWEGAAAEITDGELTAAVTKKNAAVKNSAAIKALIGQYIPPPGQLKQIEQGKRSAFLAELENVKAAA